jgi:hypothetical protein
MKTSLIDQIHILTSSAGFSGTARGTGFFPISLSSTTLLLAAS